MNCGSEIGNASKYNRSLAEPAIVDTIACIKTEQPFPVPRNNLYDRFMSGPVNPIFYQFFVKATAFQTGDTCIGCGQCVKNCPKNNIALENGKPHYHFEQLKIK